MDKLDRLRFLIKRQVRRYGDALLMEAQKEEEEELQDTDTEEEGNPFSSDPEAEDTQQQDPSTDTEKSGQDTQPAPPGGQDKVKKSNVANNLAKDKNITDPTAAPIDMGQLKNERIARFIQAVSNTSKDDLKFIINDTSPDTKAKTIRLFLKLIGVKPEDVPGLLDSLNINK